MVMPKTQRKKSLRGVFFCFFFEKCKFGGPGIVVKINESIIAKRKYQRGHYFQEQCVFSIYDSTTKLGYLSLRFVGDWSANTLPLNNMAEAGSIAHSDSWKAYDGISQIQVDPPSLHSP